MRHEPTCFSVMGIVTAGEGANSFPECCSWTEWSPSRFKLTSQEIHTHAEVPRDGLRAQSGPKPPSSLRREGRRKYKLSDLLIHLPALTLIYFSVDLFIF